MAEIKSLSHTHMAIVDYLLGHPQVSLGDVARHFGYTQPWLSSIIHSEAFQAMLQEKQGYAFHHTVLPLREKMFNAAHIAMDKIVNMLPEETDVRTVAQVADSMLDRLGFSSKPIGGAVGNLTINQQNNMIVPNANAAEIQAARALLEAKRNPALGVPVNGLPFALALPRESITEVGETVGSRNLPPAGGEDTSRESGPAVREEGTREAVS